MPCIVKPDNLDTGFGAVNGIYQDLGNLIAH